jgi:hypothetical protein
MYQRKFSLNEILEQQLITLKKTITVKTDFNNKITKTLIKTMH